MTTRPSALNHRHTHTHPGIRHTELGLPSSELTPPIMLPNPLECPFWSPER
jgi:hypothetical protein